MSKFDVCAKAPFTNSVALQVPEDHDVGAYDECSACGRVIDYDASGCRGCDADDRSWDGHSEIDHDDGYLYECGSLYGDERDQVEDEIPVHSKSASASSVLTDNRGSLSAAFCRIAHFMCDEIEAIMRTLGVRTDRWSICAGDDSVFPVGFGIRSKDCSWTISFFLGLYEVEFLSSYCGQVEVVICTNRGGVHGSDGVQIPLQGYEAEALMRCAGARLGEVAGREGVDPLTIGRVISSMRTEVSSMVLSHIAGHRAD